MVFPEQHMKKHFKYKQNKKPLKPNNQIPHWKWWGHMGLKHAN